MWNSDEVQKWDTQISHAQSLKWVSLLDDGEVLLSLEEPLNQEVYRCRIKIGCSVAYRFISAEFLHAEKVWSSVWDISSRYGRTIQFKESKWIAELMTSSDFTHSPSPELTHYAIILEEGIFEVIARDSPISYYLYGL